MNTELQRKREQYLKLLKELRAQGEVSDENYRKSQRKLFLRRLETLRALGKVSDKVYRKLDEEYSVASEEAKTEEVLDAVDLSMLGGSQPILITYTRMLSLIHI